jgi:hypothetical protein
VPLFKTAKVLNSTEDAHMKGMSTFETDEHLQAPTWGRRIAGRRPARKRSDHLED